MNIRELKEKLERFDEMLEVVCSDNCGGGYSITSIEAIEVRDKYDTNKKHLLVEIS